jgi:hypothetical protein
MGPRSTRISFRNPAGSLRGPHPAGFFVRGAEKKNAAL